jgi:hypothetical protein
MYQTAYFQIEDQHLPVKGIYDPSSRWNGWMNPAFTLENVKALEQYLMTFGEMHPAEDGTYFEVINDEVWEYSIEDGKQTDRGKVDPVTFEGESYYHICNFNWVWFIATMNDVTTELVEKLHKHRANKSLTVQFDSSERENDGRREGDYWRIYIMDSSENAILDDVIVYDEDTAETAVQFVTTNQEYTNHINVETY